jgi:hypothetical protein
MTRVLFVLALCAAGCFRMTVKNGLPVGQTPIEYDERWHSGLIFGLAELSGPYDLSKVCPQGWSQIHTETSFVAGLVTDLTQNIYTPQNVSVSCAAR